MRERRIELPVEEEYTESDGSEVFYNKEMITNRDLSEAAVAAFCSDKQNCQGIDVFGATGIRGMRYSKYLDSLIINDIDESAIEAIKKAKELNDIEFNVNSEYANKILTNNFNKFDIIDVDPYGSFAEYLDSVARSSRDQSLVGLTATDNGVTAGTYPKVCKRKYGRESRRFPFKHEIGARIYATSIIEAFTRHDKAFEPVLSFHERHYTRIIGRVSNSKQNANNLLDEFRDFYYCKDCGSREFSQDLVCGSCGSKDILRVKDIYSGKLQNQLFLRKVRNHLDDNWKAALDLLNKIEEGSEIKSPYYDIHNICSIMGSSAPKVDEVIDSLSERGYPVAKTQYSPVGIKTTAPVKHVKESIRE